MLTITSSGPAGTARQARNLLTDAGYVVLINANPWRLSRVDGEAFVTVESDDPDAPVRVIEGLGWRHRATAVAGPPMLAIPVVAIGSKGRG